LKLFLKETVSEEDAVPGAVIAIQSFGDFLGYNPHLHVPGTDGCFYGDGPAYRRDPGSHPPLHSRIWKRSSAIRSFPRCAGLLSKDKITEDLANPASAGENLARYIIRASFSQERMTYFPEDSKVVYRSKDGKEEKIFDALEWLAAMCSHVPNKGESRCSGS
jgi:hypothetical protein